MADAGVPLYFSLWRGLWLPPRTPKDVAAKLNAAVAEALADPVVHRRLAETGQEIAFREEQTPEGLRAHHKAELEKWWPIIKEAGIKPQ